jgi:hypothetical protein
MRGFQRRGVRQYNRSDEPRMRWTEKLHRQFIEAVDCLGGPDGEFLLPSLSQTKHSSLSHHMHAGLLIAHLHVDMKLDFMNNLHSRQYVQYHSMDRYR